ncbi:hypothetical protein [Vibrio sp.]|uniref:hypothetical protein n=1 Tax=Vibrio sp. TaxID=678 RepID=UPI003D10FA5D
MYSTSRHSVTHTELYNAAQTGIEMAKTIIWEKKEEINVPSDPYDYDHSSSDKVARLNSIRARTTSSDYLDSALRPVRDEYVGVQGVTVSVDILDCYYELNGVVFDDEVMKDKLAELPPQWEAGSGPGGAFSGLPEGTSAIMDPGRRIPIGTGGGQRRYVIRSQASDGDQSVIIEALVRVKDNE